MIFQSFSGNLAHRSHSFQLFSLVYSIFWGRWRSCGRPGMSAEDASSPTVLGPGAAKPCGLQGNYATEKDRAKGLSWIIIFHESSEFLWTNCEEWTFRVFDIFWPLLSRGFHRKTVGISWSHRYKASDRAEDPSGADAALGELGSTVSLGIPRIP